MMQTNNQMTDEIKIRTSVSADNEKILNLLTKVPMSSKLPIIFDKSPNYFYFIENWNFFHWHCMVAENAENEMVGFFHAQYCRIMNMPNLLTYLGDLRVLPEYRGKGIAKQLYRMFNRWLLDNNYHAYCLVNEGNDATFQLIEESFAQENLEFNCKRVGSIETCSIFLMRKKVLPSDAPYSYEKMADNDVEMILTLFKNTYQKDFHVPDFSVNDFRSLLSANLGISLENGRVVRDKISRKILAFTFIWDQSSWKKLKLARFDLKTKTIRKGYNILASLTKIAKIPGPNEHFRFFETAFYSAEDDEKLHDCFLSHIYEEMRGKGYHFFNVLNRGDKNLSNACRRFWCQRLKTSIIAFYQRDSQNAIDFLAKKPFIDLSFI